MRVASCKSRKAFGNATKDDAMFLTINPETLVDDEVRIVAFGKDANGEVQVHHLNLDNLAWMLAKH